MQLLTRSPSDNFRLIFDRFWCFFCTCLTLIFLSSSSALLANGGAEPVLPETQVSQSQWEKYGEKSGISLFREMPPGSEFYRFKGVVMFNTRIEVIGEVLKDTANYSAWMADCKKSVLLEDTGDHRKVYYVHDVPWPFKDRDVMLEATINIEYGGYFEALLQSFAGDEGAPTSDKYVRMSSMSGRYFVEYITREQTKVTFSIHVEPGGSLSPSLSNGHLDTLAYETLRNLKKMTEDPRYIELANNSQEKILIEQHLKQKALQQKTVVED